MGCQHARGTWEKKGLGPAEGRVGHLEVNLESWLYSQLSMSTGLNIQSKKNIYILESLGLKVS